MLRKAFFPQLILISVILSEGFVSISAEMLTLRQLLPFTGSSVVVTSLVIGIFLLFLALGYQRGGYHYQHPDNILCRNFLIAAIWMGVGLSYSFIAVFFYLVELLIGPHSLVTLTLYLLLITAPLIFILGQTVPITMSMFNQELSASRIGGNVLGLSTIGSFLGAILTTLFLMQFLGVAWTVCFNFMILACLILLLAPKLQLFYYVGFLVCSGAFVYILNVEAEHANFVLTNNYANYQVVTKQNSNEKILQTNGTNSSYINKEGKGFEYIEVIKRILFTEMGLRDASILVLGAGGFSLTAENTYGNHVTYVDIDPQLTKVVVPRFVQAYHGKLIVDDARHFIKSSNQRYDAIVVDVYNATHSIPAHLLTTEFMQELRGKLKIDGTVIINVIANPFMNDAYSQTVDNTIRTVFKQCMTFPHLYANHKTNIIYACQHSKRENRSVYTDNLNNSTVDALL